MKQMEQNRVVNIINFVRGSEPRWEKDLITPIREEIRLNKKYEFENTFLLQYDALCVEEIVSVFRAEKDEHMELGIWLELAGTLVESVGIKWTGRWDWDWHVNPGFLPAYTREQKEKLIDGVMEKFHEIFGYYPRSAGSWILDSDSIKYMKEKYRIQAVCICREQWGTDGYTLWGGYYNGAYFPSVNHMLHPAQTLEKQIHVPVFRMLGADPVYSYYEKLYGRYDGKDFGLYTLEPAWPSGMDSKWVEWYFRNFSEQEDMGYSYTQTGQENSFGWELISKGLPMQMAYLNQLREEGKIRVEKLCDSGRRFSQMHEMTPAGVYSALDDWADEGRQSIWFSNRYYRTNVYCDGEMVWIRDIHIFDEDYRDVYLDEPCQDASAFYDALPVIDGVRFGDNVTRAGICLGTGRISGTGRHGEQFWIHLNVDGEEMILIMAEQRIAIKSQRQFTFPVYWKEDCEDIKKVEKNGILYSHNGLEYRLLIKKGKLEPNGKQGAKLLSEKNCAELEMACG